DYLQSKPQFNSDYAYTIKSRLLRKLQIVINQELPLLYEKGYLTENCKNKKNKGHVAHEQTNKTGIEHTQNDTTHGTYEPWQGVCTG
ncbi:MAG: hypothetical protein ACJ70O_04195, partial [Nitrososphaera sp.]